MRSPRLPRWRIPPPPPRDVSTVSLSRADGSVTAKWNAPSGATHYHVTYSDDGGASWSLAALEHSSNSITFGVDNASTYIVGVRAGNEHGWSGWVNSPPAGPYVPPLRPPAYVGAVNVTRADGSLTASWDAVDRATRHHVTYTSDKGASWSLAALDHPSNSITISVDNAKTYVVGVRAGNDAGWSGWTNSPAAGPYVPPTPPTVSATRGEDGDTATVKWTAYDGSDFSYYRVIICTDAQYDGSSCSGTVFQGDPVYKASSTGPVTVNGLEAQTAYGVILQTWRTGGALKSHATLPGGPSINAPTGLTATPNDDGNLAVSWNAVDGATGYDVQSSASLTGDSWQTAHSNTTSTSVTVTDDANDPIERVRVRARNSGGAGPWAEQSRMPNSNWLTSVGGQGGGVIANGAQIQSAYTAPVILSRSRDNNPRDERIHLTWTPEAVGGYHVVCSWNGGWTWWHCGTVSGSQGSHTVTDHNPISGTMPYTGDLFWENDYMMAVRAVPDSTNLNAPGASPWSRSESIDPAVSPYGVRFSTSGSAVTIYMPRWGYVTGYELEINNPASHCDTVARTDCITGTFSGSLGVNAEIYKADVTHTGSVTSLAIRYTNDSGKSGWVGYGSNRRITSPISVDATTAAATVTLPAWDDAPYIPYWYKYAEGSDVSSAACTKALTGSSVNLTGLTAGATYAFKVYTDSTCAGADEIASTSFTTSGVSVSNLTATSDTIGSKIYSGNPHVTGFTTGGNSGGYTLNSVTVKFLASSGTPGTLTMAIVSDSNGSPGTNTYTLSGAAPTTAGEYTYTCTKTQSVTCALDANTTYYLSVTGSSLGPAVGYFHADTTASTSETNTPSNAGWSIANAAKVYNQRNDNWADANGWTGIFKVIATPKPSLTASNVTATGATLTIAGHTEAWYYKSTTTGKTTCESAGSVTSVTLTGLTAGTAYVFSAYSDSSCSTLLATAAAFTPTSLTVSNVGTTTARITVGGHTGQWWYKADSGPHNTCQGPVAAGTSYKDLTGLTAGSFYVYTAYSASGCADTVKLATAGVSTAVTVSNLGATATNTLHPIDAYGQGFTTGDADATLLSATVQFGDAFGSVNATISLRAAQSNGKPATTDRATLSGTPVKGQQSTFTCADGGSNDCSLDANTKYFIYVSGSSGYLVSTASNTETLQPAGNGWSIEDAMRRRTSFDLLGSGYAMKIEVEAVPHEELSVSSVTATGATLTIKRHLGDWYYKSTTTGQTTCTSAGSGTSVSVSGLTGGTSYTFSAYSDSTCTTGNLLATAPSFTTPVTVSTLGGALYQHYQVGNYLDTQQQGAQGFTTGSNTGGYTLSSIDIRINSKVGSPTNLEVTLHAASGSNPNTGTTLATLSGASSPSSAGTYPYTCSGSGCNLLASTTYFVLMKAPSSPGTSYYTVHLTSAAETKQPSNNGWSIADKGREGLYGSWLDMQAAVKMKVSAVP